MSNYSENDSGDYVLVHKSKAKISRARKMVIGAMAIGAVAALTNSGTFASFSASTTNDATFSTAKLVLGNQKNTSATTCFSDDTTTDGAHDAVLDTNDRSCAAFFGSALKPGDTATAGVTLSNAGSTTAALTLAADSACAAANGTGSAGSALTATICGHMRFTVSAADTSWAADPSACVYPAIANACSVTTASRYGDLQDFSTHHRFDDTVADTAPGTAAGGAVTLGNLTTVTPKNYIVTVYFPKTVAPALHNVLGTPCDVNGFTPVGVGCDNLYMNKIVTFKLRWLLSA